MCTLYLDAGGHQGHTIEREIRTMKRTLRFTSLIGLALGTALGCDPGPTVPPPAGGQSGRILRVGFVASLLLESLPDACQHQCRVCGHAAGVLPVLVLRLHQLWPAAHG